ncbi:MAG: tRNA uridine-5-carboxymethylaminomethyl(34) synthesis GTPase MnmE, partial [Methylophaga sp.]|nr:tRNA uridine-5-carboxymethylaminomethyl(34) synthesis GTPase MnmE [Methylophaga sp.]
METIVAIATAPGRGGVGVVRLSGSKSAEIARQICGSLGAPRFAKFSHFRDHDGEIIDSGVVLFFPNPASFTGEDVVELQGHGSPLVLDRLCQRAISLGARMARPGEFSERAFLNNKMDLAQAEA